MSDESEFFDEPKAVEGEIIGAGQAMTRKAAESLTAIGEERFKVIREDDLDGILNLRLFAKFAKDLSKRWGERADEMLKTYIETTGKPVYVGEIKFYVGVPKTTKNNSVTKTAEWFYANEFDRLGEALSSSAFKHGACKKIMPPDVYAEHFTESSAPELVEGKTPKKLIEHNQAFTK